MCSTCSSFIGKPGIVISWSQRLIHFSRLQKKVDCSNRKSCVWSLDALHRKLSHFAWKFSSYERRIPVLGKGKAERYLKYECFKLVRVFSNHSFTFKYWPRFSNSETISSFVFQTKRNRSCVTFDAMPRHIRYHVSGVCGAVCDGGGLCRALARWRISLLRLQRQYWNRLERGIQHLWRVLCESMLHVPKKWVFQLYDAVLRVQEYLFLLMRP